jgi:hypothetical protein
MKNDYILSDKIKVIRHVETNQRLYIKYMNKLLIFIDFLKYNIYYLQ